MLTLAAVLALAEACAPSVAPSTLAAIVQVESRFDPIAIGVNGSSAVKVEASSAADAAAKAKALIADGRSIDLGLAQINNKNLQWLGLAVEDAFDPCLSLAAAARVLHAGFNPAGETSLEQQAALRVALSRYNTGDSRRGFANGYVAKVVNAASLLVPPTPQDSGQAPIPSAPPPWDVFGHASADGRFLIRVSTTTEGAAP